MTLLQLVTITGKLLIKIQNFSLTFSALAKAYGLHQMGFMMMKFHPQHTIFTVGMIIFILYGKLVKFYSPP